MENLLSIVQNCYNFYVKNPNMNMTFQKMKSLQGRCNEFLDLIKDDKTMAIKLQNSLDSMVISDEFLEVLSYTYSDVMSKQVKAFSEDGMIEFGLVEFKHRFDSYDDYMAKLRTFSIIVNIILDHLKQGKIDLKNMYGYLTDIENKYNKIINEINEKKYSNEQGRSYVASVLNGRIDKHKEILSYINNANSKINSVIAYYNQLLSKIENEKEISTDLNKIVSN